MKVMLNRYVRVLLLAFLLLAGGCAITPWEACESAKTLDAKGTCYYGAFAATETQAANLVEDPNVPVDAKAVIRSIDAKAKPLADSLLEASLTYGQVRRDVKAGKETEGTLATVATKLQGWLDRAVPVMEQLVDAVAELF